PKSGISPPGFPTPTRPSPVKAGARGGGFPPLRRLRANAQKQKGGIEMRAIIVRESIPVLPSGPAPSLAVVYDGDLAAYEGGLGMYDEGDDHVWRTAIVNLTPHEIVVRREDGSDLRI